ncbi:MAG: bifunctional demethylmenaquinone methyltransferase/2-methoxy-6-polyprenyl-1,4-benzoquinol methylase UbiE [bacterium]
MSKGSYIQLWMFNRVASKYDLFNKTASFFLDERWRARAVEGLKPAKNILDLCTGTGEMALRLVSRVGSTTQVVGIDFSEKMLSLAQKKMRRRGYASRIQFLQTQAENLPFFDNSFDCVTNAFSMRNVVDNLEVVLREMHRVVKPKGKVIILELGKPESVYLRKIYYLYLQFILPWYGLALFGKKWPLLYLRSSIINFFSLQEFKEKLKKAGFQSVDYSPFTGGIAGVYIAIKPRA